MKFPMWKIQTAMGLTQAKESTRRETDTLQESDDDAATTGSDESEDLAQLIEQHNADPCEEAPPRADDVDAGEEAAMREMDWGETDEVAEPGMWVGGERDPLPSIVEEELMNDMWEVDAQEEGSGGCGAGASAETSRAAGCSGGGRGRSAAVMMAPPLALWTTGEDADRVEEPDERGGLKPVPWCGSSETPLEGREARRCVRKVEFEAVYGSGVTTNYELRGEREPVGSMGLYHYVMYVYEVLRSEKELVDPLCALRYAYDEHHPRHHTHMQCLRLFGGFRVPLVEGWTHCTSAKSLEQNAAYKAVLLRPFTDVSWKEGTQCNLLTKDRQAAPSWIKWFHEQQRLAQKLREKEAGAGKGFVLADVYVREHYAELCAPPADAEVAQRPTPEEFFAGITVEVATNLDEMAASKGRPRRRLDLTGVRKEKKFEEVPRAPGPGKGGCEGDEDAEFNKQWIPDETTVIVHDDDVERYCNLGREAAPGRSWQYAAEFLHGAGALLGVEMEDAAHKDRGPRKQTMHKKWTASAKRALKRASVKGSPERDGLEGAVLKQQEAFAFTRSGRGGIDTQDEEHPPHHVLGLGKGGVPEAVLKKVHDGGGPADAAAAQIAELEAREPDPGKERVRFNEDQMDAMALAVLQLQRVYEHGLGRKDRPEGISARLARFERAEERLARHAKRAMLPPLRCGARQLTMGGGGSGKSMIQMAVIQPISELFLKACKALASSNAVARQCEGGETMHSGMRLRAECSLKLDELVPQGDALLDLQAAWGEVQGLLLEELSMWPPKWLYGMAYRLGHVRKGVVDGRDGDPTNPLEVFFAAVALVRMNADFLQLPPVAHPSVAMHTVAGGVVDTDSLGQRLFRRSLTWVLTLNGSERFTHPETLEPCQYQTKLLQVMRLPPAQGKSTRGRLPADVWSRLCHCTVTFAGEVPRSALLKANTRKAPAKGERPGEAARAMRMKKACERLCARDAEGDPLYPIGKSDRNEVAIQWEAVARMMQCAVRRQAAEAGEMVYYIPAIDRSNKEITRADYERMWKLPNYNNAGHAMGMLAIFVGMRVRLETKLSAKDKIVQGAKGVVQRIEFHDEEDTTWMLDPNSAEIRRGWVRLNKMPRGVVVAFDNFAGDLGYGADPSLVMVGSNEQSWKFKTRRQTKVWEGNRWLTKPLEIRVWRTQIRLFPERTGTAQASQGHTFDTMMAHLAKPAGMKASEYWFNVYLMLSRSRCLDPSRVMLFDLPPKEFFEAGPPIELVKALREFEAIEADTRAFAKRVRAYMQEHHGWPADGERVRPDPPQSDAARRDAGRKECGEQMERERGGGAARWSGAEAARVDVRERGRTQQEARERSAEARRKGKAERGRPRG